jgi:hypothetical protein
VKSLDQLYAFRQVNGQQDLVVAEETEQVLMRAAQEEDKKKCYLVLQIQK